MKLIGIYPGRFQPPHKGHYKVYEYLKKMVGEDNAYVATSNFVKVPDSPLSFSDKQQMWAKYKVPSDKIVQVNSPYQAKEILDKYNQDNTAALFLVGKKDVERLNTMGKNYFIRYKRGQKEFKPIKTNAYIVVVSDTISSVDGKAIGGTDIRKVLGSNIPDDLKKKFFEKFIGWFDIALFDRLKDVFTQGNDQKAVNEITIPTLVDDSDEQDIDDSLMSPEEERLQKEKGKLAADTIKKKIEFNKKEEKFGEEKKKNLRLQRKGLEDENRELRNKNI